jgi:hypothetical protein
MKLQEIITKIRDNKAHIRALIDQNAALYRQLRACMQEDAKATIDQHARTLATRYGYPIEQLRERHNSADISCARNNVMARLVLDHGYSCQQVGEYMGRQRGVVHRAVTLASSYPGGEIPPMLKALKVPDVK